MKKKATRTQTAKTKPRSESVVQLDLHPLEAAKIALTYKNDVQRRMGRMIAQSTLTVCAGSPGTGKTLVSCAEAFILMKKNPEVYKEIILVKSVTELPDEELGFVKGTVREKMDPHVHSFISNMEKLTSRSTVRRMEEEGYLRIFPIAYLRGANLDNCIVIVDEAQNISIRNMRTILTRIGSDCKMIVLGDENQSDLRDRSVSSLHILFSMVEGGEIPSASCVRFGDEHIVRNSIVGHIEAAFRARSL